MSHNIAYKNTYYYESTIQKYEIENVEKSGLDI